MPNLPIRGLGKVGVIADANPYDLPVAAWSNARNLRFDINGVTRSSVFKPFLMAQDFTSPPIYVVDDSLKQSAKAITSVRANGTMTRLSEGVITDVTPTGNPASIGNITGTIAGSVSYINTPNVSPVAFASGEERYATIPNLEPGVRFGALRSYRDFLIGLYTTKDALEYPNMVKWSDAISVGTRPNWDVAAENGLAGENVLNGSTGYLVDGAELGGSFIVYGSKEVFRMDYIGTPLIFSFENLFSDVRIMTQNCIAQANSKHFVFCEDDIIVTDGISKESICDGRVRKTIFDRLDFGKRDACRAIHNQLKSEIIFTYPSRFDQAAWEVDSTGCNEAAVYNYEADTWSFIDLPNVTCGANVVHPAGTVGTSPTWEGLAVWSDLKGNWSFSTVSPSTLILASAGNPDKEANVYFYDDDVFGYLSNPIDVDLNWPAWSETKLADFDEVGFPLHSTKLVRTLVPQVDTADPSSHVMFYIMGENLGTDDSNWTNPMEFNPFTDFKLNTRANGRYISIRFEVPAGTYANFSGYDLDIIQIARR